MSNWTVAACCQSRTLGILELQLTDVEQKKHSPYLFYKCAVHLRSGVVIGRTTASSTLVTFHLRASTDFLARLDAEHQAEKWLAENIDSLIEEKP